MGVTLKKWRTNLTGKISETSEPELSTNASVTMATLASMKSTNSVTLKSVSVSSLNESCVFYFVSIGIVALLNAWL